MRGRGRRRDPTRARRTGPAEESPWWDPDDQAWAERPLVARRTLGRGWLVATMLNNAERLDPYGDDPDSEAVRAAREARRLSALDEGSAWRRRQDGALAVLRVEVFAALDDGTHRAAWREHGAGCLDAVWRARWRERDRSPSWIEARWREEAGLPLGDGVDWIEVEDQTGSSETGVVSVYEHVTVWAGRALVTLTVRHPQTESVDDEVRRVLASLAGPLAEAPR